jgi:hypothetical protein
MKLVELEILKISYLGNFSSYYMFLEVILKNNFEVKSLGVATVDGELEQGSRRHGRRARHHGLPRPSRAPQLASSSSRVFSWPRQAPWPST